MHNKYLWWDILNAVLLIFGFWFSVEVVRRQGWVVLLLLLAATYLALSLWKRLDRGTTR